jgi:hypothetical protein
MRDRNSVFCLGIVAIFSIFASGRSPGADEMIDADEKYLQQARVGIDGASLLEFFRARSLTDRDRQELEAMILRLGSARFTQREQASLKLTAYGPPALPFLREALKNPDPEVARRAMFIIEEIERGPGPSLPAAATRLLAARKPAGAVKALLTYLPFNDDDAVEDEIVAALGGLGYRNGMIDPALSAALPDPQPARRSAAAYVLGRVGDPEQRATVHKLLADSDPKVRLRAAQGLIAARDRSAVPVLVALLTDAPLTLCWQAEEQLFRIAGEKAPLVSVGDGAADARKKSRDAWAAWWRDQGAQVDLSLVEDRQRQLGLTVIAELDSNKVWECGPDGKPRWKLENLQGPIDAHVLPGGRVLVAENQAQRVTERDLKGNILWEKHINQNPIACQRLPNGNTFIATYQSVMEVTRAGKEVFTHNHGPGFFIFGAQKLRNGHILCISAQGSVIELDSAGKEVKTRQVTNNGGWCGIEGLPGGHILIAMTSNNKVAELDASGKEVWKCTTIAGPCSATRLPNGNTLVASMAGQRVVEVDRSGKRVWEQRTEGRPFRVHRR